MKCPHPFTYVCERLYKEDSADSEERNSVIAFTDGSCSCNFRKMAISGICRVQSSDFGRRAPLYTRVRNALFGNLPIRRTEYLSSGLTTDGTHELEPILSTMRAP